MEQFFYKDFHDFFMENIFSENILEKYFLKKTLNRRLFNKTFLSKKIFFDNYINRFLYKYYEMSEYNQISFNEFIQKTCILFKYIIKNNIKKIHITNRDTIIVFIKNIKFIYVKIVSSKFKNKYAYIGDYFINIKHYLKLFFGIFTSIVVDIIKDEQLNYSDLNLNLLLSLCLERRFATNLIKK